MLKLAQILYDRRISQAGLARLADINQADLNTMIHGKRPAYPGWRKRIAKALGMEGPEADQLFEEIQELKEEKAQLRAAQ